MSRCSHSDKGLYRAIQARSSSPRGRALQRQRCQTRSYRRCHTPKACRRASHAPICRVSRHVRLGECMDERTQADARSCAHLGKCWACCPRTNHVPLSFRRPDALRAGAGGEIRSRQRGAGQSVGRTGYGAEGYELGVLRSESTATNKTRRCICSENAMFSHVIDSLGMLTSS